MQGEAGDAGKILEMRGEAGRGGCHEHVRPALCMDTACIYSSPINTSQQTSAQLIQAVIQPYTGCHTALYRLSYSLIQAAIQPYTCCHTASYRLSYSLKQAAIQPYTCCHTSLYRLSYILIHAVNSLIKAVIQPYTGCHTAL